MPTTTAPPRHRWQQREWLCDRCGQWRLGRSWGIPQAAIANETLDARHVRIREQRRADAASGHCRCCGGVLLKGYN